MSVIGNRGDRERRGREDRQKVPFPAPGDPLQRRDPIFDRGGLPGTIRKPDPPITPKDIDDDDADAIKKRKRIEEIKAANRAKRKGIGAKKNVSGYGTVSPLLTGTEAGTGFSLSSIPPIVWIILAVGGGIYLIKSAGKRK